MDNRIVIIEPAEFGCYRANGNLIEVENKGSFYKAISRSCEDVCAVAYTVDGAIMECVRKIDLHKAANKFAKINKKHHIV